MAASLSEVQKALDEAAGKRGFKCVPVSWEDAQRGTVGGALSCWGGNISDVRLWEKSGKLLYTLRTENWNERLGYVSSRDVAVVTGNHVPGGSQPNPVTLRSFLEQFKTFAGYTGIESTSLFSPDLDNLCTIRFQTVFLPIEKNEHVEFCTEVYNYNTMSDTDPRNMTVLCTPQGTSVQHDGSGAQKIFFHEVDREGGVHRYWLEAERSAHKVGGEQKETEEEAAEAASRGKATAIRMGTRAMGTRFNVQMLIQIPVKQTRPVDLCDSDICDSDSCDEGWCKDGVEEEFAMECETCECKMAEAGDDDAEEIPMAKGAKRSRQKEERKLGVSNAARVSRGSEQDVWGGVLAKAPERDPSQHATITVTMYYTVAGGIPTPQDVIAAVEDLDSLYQKCPSDKKLVDCTEVTSELTVKEMMDISRKVGTQPYQPPVFPPKKDEGFPE